jgi:hypothetical protein
VYGFAYLYYSVTFGAIRSIMHIECNHDINLRKLSKAYNSRKNTGHQFHFPKIAKSVLLDY